MKPPAPTPPRSAPLDGVRLAFVTSGGASVVSEQTILLLRQRGSIVTGSYEGGRVRAGALVGLLRGEDLHFRYVQVGDTDAIDAGESRCEVSRLPDGRVRIVEHYEWTSRPGTGVNVLEELKGTS